MPEIIEHRLLREHQYAIVSRAAAERMPHGLPLVPLSTQRLRRDENLLPWLLPLAQLSLQQFNDLLQDLVDAPRAGRAPIAQFLLRTTGDVNTVRRSASLRMTVTQQLDEGIYLLRYYDPRVWAQLLRMLLPWQLSYGNKSLRQVTYWLDGHWHVTDLDEIHARGPVVGLPRLDRSTFARLARIGAINEVLRRLGASGGAEQMQALSGAVEQALVRAESVHRFPEEIDRVAFAVHAMQIAPDFDRHPRIEQLIAHLAQDDLGYRDATDLMSLEAWSQIKTDIDRTKGAPPSKE